MNPQKKFCVLLVFTLASLAASCSDVGKVNKLVGEGDAAVREADRLAQESNQLIGRLSGSLDDREQLKATAQESIELTDKAVAKLREAASKYDEASKANIGAELKEYMSLRSQEWNKHAEHLEVMKEYPQAFLDPAVDREALEKKIADVNGRIAKLQAEWTDLRARAAAIREKNKDKFENNN